MRKLFALFVLLLLQQAASAADPSAKPTPKSTPVLPAVAAASAASAAAQSATAAASAASAAVASAAQAASAASGVAAASSAPLRIERVFVRDKAWLERLFGVDRADAEKREAACRNAGDFRSCNPTLIGTGEIELVISRNDFERVAAAEKTFGGISLYLNGVALPSDARRVATEQLDDGTHLRFQIEQGTDTQTLWSSLYKAKGLFGQDGLRVALAWNGQGPGSSLPPVLTPDNFKGPGVRIAVTSEGYVIAAAVVVTVLIGGLFVIGWKTDALRVVPLPTWWSEAGQLRIDLAAVPATQQTGLLQAFEPAYDPAKQQDYIQLAHAAAKGLPAPAPKPKLISIGLALAPGALAEPRRPAYSLARTQLAMWFAFAIAAGLFLWIIYGELRRIDGSLLALLLISVGTTGASIGVDKTNPEKQVYLPSRGLFLDLVTDQDDTQQVHRYQAVVVNLLLLFVGVVHVIQQLTYPIFEPTWLAFLGVSGATLGLGKQVLEKGADTPDGGPKPPAPAPAPAPAAAPAPAPASASASASGAVG